MNDEKKEKIVILIPVFDRGLFRCNWQEINIADIIKIADEKFQMEVILLEWQSILFADRILLSCTFHSVCFQVYLAVDSCFSPDRCKIVRVTRGHTFAEGDGGVAAHPLGKIDSFQRARCQTIGNA